MKLNKDRYMEHKMPKNATVDQRIAWHLEHFKNCQFRIDIPAKLRVEMEKRGIKIK
ncbi:hypothetical protein [Arenibacter sp. F20364]|uniref:hypothetical protein n=1 Tax=Arenibacter sp. F20364 TaxID=2926415 RepID=UPI001FF40E5B|nr:hypothetical protein [Arenibacter sp. F20364]MCK0188399.1 hypothetical protein [Arenibacter sp. F20364]